MDLETLKSNWNQLLAKGINKILEELDDQLKLGTNASNQYHLIKGRFNALVAQKIEGIVSYEEQQVSQNQIRKSLIDFIGTLDERDIVGNVKSQKSHFMTSILSLENRLEEINETIQSFVGIDSPKGKTLLKEIIKENIDIKEDLGLIHLVNCDRMETMDLFWTAYDQKLENNNFFQYYFLLGCPSQMPHSFSERMVYEIMSDSTLNNEESAIHSIVDNEGRIKIEKLPEGRKLEQSQKEFKKYFSKRFSFHQDVSFDDYVKTGLPHLDYDCVTFVFQISENKWKKDTAAYLDWLVQLFNVNHDNLPKFIFFFIIKMNNIHLENGNDEQQKNILHQIESVVSKYPTATIFDPLNPVHEKHLKEWLSDIGEDSPTAQNIVLDAFVKGLYDKEGKKIKQYKDGKLLNMDDIQRFQEIIYDFYNENYEI